MDYEDALLSLIGHMLRQNLINIAELSNLMLVESDGTLTENVRADAVQIKAEAADALGTIDDILRLARDNSMSGEITTVSLASVIRDIIPKCAQKALAGDTGFCVDSATIVEGRFRANVAALEGAITQAIMVLHGLAAGYVIHFSAEVTETAVTLNFQTPPGQGPLFPASIIEVFKKVRNVTTLINMLDGLRLVQAGGGQIILLQEKNQERVFAFQMRFPLCK